MLSGHCRAGCSPLARGWSVAHGPRALARRVLPARAGMVLSRTPRLRRRSRAPRSRGDGPGLAVEQLLIEGCSPLARGWSPTGTTPSSPGSVLPARAGMVSPAPSRDARGPGAPRSRGDGPYISPLFFTSPGCSPLARGWSHELEQSEAQVLVLPARAGMVPVGPYLPGEVGGAPRSRGDGPASGSSRRESGWCSPLARGWSRADAMMRRATFVLPARAGMVPLRRSGSTPRRRAPRSRGDGPASGPRTASAPPCSPLARGWSRLAAVREALARVLPARAGMVRTRTAPRRCSSRAPRSRGDGPPIGRLVAAGECVLPARAGMVRPQRVPLRQRQRAPRSRGDGPATDGAKVVEPRCSPLARGWSPVASGHFPRRAVLPARAGMVPPRAATASNRVSAPRSRGDGPVTVLPPMPIHECSPLARGWSPALHTRPQGPGVLPARAGMVPERTKPWPMATCAPRSRGDGPSTSCSRRQMGQCSPLARGWSRHHRLPRPGRGVLPARAGMVPCRRVPVSSSTSAPRSRGDGPERGRPLSA